MTLAKSTKTGATHAFSWNTHRKVRRHVDIYRSGAVVQRKDAERYADKRPWRESLESKGDGDQTREASLGTHQKYNEMWR